MDKMTELREQLENLRNEAQKLITEGKAEEAKNKIALAQAVKQEMELQQQLDEQERMVLEAKSKSQKQGEQKGAGAVRAMIKRMLGKPLTEAENALLIPSSAPGTNGEGYILPQEISTRIREKMRDYSGIRDVIGYMPSSALTGSFPVEKFDTLKGLVDFSDGTEGAEVDDIQFENVAFALKEMAAFISISNTMLAVTDNSMIDYIARVFAKKAVVTEVTKAVEAMKKTKSAKPLTNLDDLEESINTDIDPAALMGSVILTNQDGFQWMDKQKDTNGRGLLQPDPTNATRKMYKGLPIKVLSNGLLKTAESKIPFFYGNLKEGIILVDLDGIINFASSREAGFTKNVTIARLIEWVDVVQADKSDKCYCYGEVTVGG